MANLTTKFMGIEIKNPVVVGACELTADMDKLRDIEKYGAGAVVIKSLFEEQIQLESYKMEKEMAEFDDINAEMVSLFPEKEHAGPAEHLMWLKEAKKALSIPVIASLNAVNKETWVEYAKQIEETGVDGIELNFYANTVKLEKSGNEIEKEQLEVLKAVKKAVKIPVGVKLSSFYTNPLNFVKKLDEAKADGVVLFNQFFQPDIDIQNEKNIYPFNLSDEKDQKLPLRYAGLLHGNVEASICASSGIYDGEAIVKMLLAGADCVQVVSVLYKNNLQFISELVKEISSWMDKKSFASINDFKGKLSRKQSTDPWAYKRAQYIKLLLKPDPLS